MAQAATRTARRLTAHLEKAQIPYALVGSMAVELHGASRLTDDVGVLLTGQSFDVFRQKFLGEMLDPVPGRPRRFIERATDIPVEVFLTGHHPGRRGPTPVPFPDPQEDSVEIQNI